MFMIRHAGRHANQGAGRHSWLATLVIGAGLLAGCAGPAPEPLSLAAGVPAAGASIAVIAIAPCKSATTCEDFERGGAFARFDAKGLETAGLFGAIAEGAHGAISTELGSLDNSDLIQAAWLDEAAAMVRADGFNLVDAGQSLYLSDELPETSGVPMRRLDTSSIPQIAGKASVAVPVPSHDVASVGRAAGADYVLGMDVLRHGVDRHFGNFGTPFTVPFAVGATRVYLVDANDGTLLYNAYAEKVTALSEEESSDKELEREALVQATRDALRTAIEDNRERLRTALGSAS